MQCGTGLRKTPNPARLALRVCLETIGGNEMGFSMAGAQFDGQPLRIGG